MQLCILAVLVSLSSAQIRVLSPTSLEQNPLLQKGVMYGTTAIFGAPHYGTRMLGEVVYYAPEHQHCESSDFEKYPVRDTGFRADDMKIYAVDRGGCAFEKKVRLAQDRGADAVIVVDFPCAKQREMAIAEGHPDMPCRDSEAIQRIVMADTSGASDIKIPSILISREEGELLLAAITKGGSAHSQDEVSSSTSDDQVVVMLLWDIPRSDFVSVDFWMSSAATDTSYFMSQFEPYATELGSLIQFSPHYSISQMSRSQVYKSSSCLSSEINGKETFFCDSQFSNLGEDVVKEDVRQLCIWHSTVVQEKASSTNKIVSFSPKYWSYMSQFYETCHPSRNKNLSNPFSETCAERIMKNVGIEINDVNWCLKNMKPPQCQFSIDSINKPECASSFHLLQDQASHQAWSHHALRINGWRYSGPLEATVVLKTICQGFVDVPDLCNDVELLHGYRTIIPFKKLNSAMAWFLAMSMLTVLGFAFWLYRRNLKNTLRSVLREEVMLEVRSQMADYAMLAEDEESATGGNGYSHKGRAGSDNRVLELTRFTPQQTSYAPIQSPATE